MCDGRIIEGNKLKETKMNKFLISSLLGVSTMSACFGVTYWDCLPGTETKAPKGYYYACPDGTKAYTHQQAGTHHRCHLEIMKCKKLSDGPQYMWLTQEELGDMNKPKNSTIKMNCCEHKFLCKATNSNHCSDNNSPQSKGGKTKVDKGDCYKCVESVERQHGPDLPGCVVPNSSQIKANCSVPKS